MKKLTREDIPEGFNLAAVDANGTAYAYQSKPILKDDVYFWLHGNKNDNALWLGSGFDSSDWKNSLIHINDEAKPLNPIKKLTINDIPEGYYFAAVDSDGFAYAYKNKPIIKHHIWIGNGLIGCIIGKGFDASDWQNSLICKEDNDQTDKSQGGTSMESPMIERCAFVFSQEPNCIGTTDKDEQIEIVFDSDLGVDRDKGGFFILKTKAWSINNEDDIKQLLDRIRVLIKKD